MQSQRDHMSAVHAGTKQWNKFINSGARKQRKQSPTAINESVVKVFACGGFCCVLRAAFFFQLT